jgi:hypothetical protein
MNGHYRRLSPIAERFSEGLLSPAGPGLHASLQDPALVLSQVASGVITTIAEDEFCGSSSR